MNAQAREESKCSLAAQALQSSGVLQLRATGTSMLPALWPGDLLTIQSHGFEQTQLGDIVLYQREGRFFVHRIVGKCSARDEQRFLIARGDCMPAADSPVGANELLGRVTAVRRAGLFFAPPRRLSPFRLIFAWMLCHQNLFQRVVLRLYALRNNRQRHLEAAVVRAAS